MGMDNLIEGSVRYTKHGYRCKNCGFNFFFDFTSPVFQCPKCGRIINDKGAYYISRLARAAGIAFAIIMVLGIAGIYYFKNEQVLLPAGAVGLLVFLVLLFQQTWSLVLSRVMYRGILVLLIVALVLVIPAFILDALKLYEYNGPMIVAAILVIGLIVTIASLVLFRVNAKTYDYQNMGPTHLR